MEPIQPRLPNFAPSVPKQVVGGAPAPSGSSIQSYETTPILDGKLITETAETAYKAHREPRVPLMLGSNSADSAGNRIRATTKEQFSTQIWEVERVRRRQLTIPTEPLIWPRWYRGQTTILAKQNRPALRRVSLRPMARPFFSTGSPTFRPPCGKSFGPEHHTAAKLPSYSAPWVPEVLDHRHPLQTDEDRRSQKWRKATGSTSPRQAIRMARTCRPWPRYDPGNGLIFEFHPDGTAGAIPDPWKARLDVMQLATESGKRAD